MSKLEDYRMLSLKGFLLFVIIATGFVVPVSIGQTGKVLSGRELLRAMRGEDTEPPDRNGTRPEQHNPERVEKKWSTVNELLGKFAENQDKYQSFIVRAEFETKGILELPDGSRPDADNTMTGEYRFDGERFTQRHVTFVHNTRSYTSNLWDGNSWYDNSRGANGPGRLIISKTTTPLRDKSRLSREKAISPWLGYFYGYDERIDTILLEAIKSGRSVSLQDTMQEIGRSNCYVITATTKPGKYTIWLDPNKDYNIVKAIVEKRAGDSYLDKPPMKEGESIYYKLDYIQYKKQGDAWIPQKAKWQQKAIGLQGFVETVTECNFTEVTLDPNHEALGSFVPDDVMNGATVYIRGVPGITYTWRDGKVVDAQGREVDLEALKPQEPVSLVGKQMPVLEQFGAKLDPAEAEGKKLLVCFWDMQQRPSRYLVRELAKKTQELKDKGVVVVCIQASKVKRGKLDAWVKGNRISFAVGMIEGDEEKARFKWGVKSLPWLILADKKHVVRAEGFGIGELDETLKQIGKDVKG